MVMNNKELNSSTKETKKLIKHSKKQNDAFGGIRSVKDTVEKIGDISIQLHPISESDNKRRSFEKVC